MNHTKNYNLPQWELNDLIRMEDFNSMNASIENGLTSTAADATSAKETAETARRTAVAAFSPANMPYAVGSYTGSGLAFQEIHIGFRPSFVLICSNQNAYNWERVGKGMAMAGPSIDSRHIFFTEQGFRVDGRDTANFLPAVNDDGVLYNYIAFR